MNELPPIVYSKAFWEALSVFISGALGLLVFLGVVDASWAVPASVLSAWIFSLLRLFGVEPELRYREALKRLDRTEDLVKQAAVIRNDLLSEKSAAKASKKSK